MCATFEQTSTSEVEEGGLTVSQLHQLIMLSRDKIRELIKTRQTNVHRNMLVVNVLKTAAKQYQDSKSSTMDSRVSSLRRNISLDDLSKENKHATEDIFKEVVYGVVKARTPVTQPHCRAQIVPVIKAKPPIIANEYTEDADFFSF